MKAVVVVVRVYVGGGAQRRLPRRLAIYYFIRCGWGKTMSWSRSNSKPAPHFDFSVLCGNIPTENCDSEGTNEGARQQPRYRPGPVCGSLI
jgi:hypothetical protein